MRSSDDALRARCAHRRITVGNRKSSEHHQESILCDSASLGLTHPRIASNAYIQHCLPWTRARREDVPRTDMNDIAITVIGRYASYNSTRQVKTAAKSSATAVLGTEGPGRNGLARRRRCGWSEPGLRQIALPCFPRLQPSVGELAAMRRWRLEWSLGARGNATATREHGDRDERMKDRARVCRPAAGRAHTARPEGA